MHQDMGISGSRQRLLAPRRHWVAEGMMLVLEREYVRVRFDDKQTVNVQ